MADVYDKAAVRHLNDAQLLEKEGRRANADHLYGFAAECALKVAIEQSTGRPLPADDKKHHLPALWWRASLHPIQKRFPMLLALLKTNPPPFDDWHVNQRYDDGSAITREVVERHRNIAKRLLGFVRLGASRGAETSP